jgi:hypothetical protein
MKKKEKKNYVIILFLFLFTSLQAQDINNRWTVGIGSGSLLYSENDLKSIGFRYAEQFPRISIARYMFKNVTFAGSFSQSVDDNKKYITFDGELRYDFGTSENLITVYALLGGSLIDTKHLLPLVNFGIGGNLWVYKNFGFAGQFIYKYNNSGFQSQASHVFASAGIVYRFSVDTDGIRRAGKKTRTRLWEMKH